MSKKPPAKRATKAKKKEPITFDWSGVFEKGRIKTQLQNADPDVGILPKKSLELIGTCSTLLLRKIVQASTAGVEKSQQQVLVLSADHIQEGVANDPSLSFLADAVEEAVQTEDNKLAQRKEKRKIAKKSAKKAAETLGVSKECLEQAVEVSKQDSVRMGDQIIMDEEDYD